MPSNAGGASDSCWRRRAPATRCSIYLLCYKVQIVKPEELRDRPRSTSGLHLHHADHLAIEAKVTKEKKKLRDEQTGADTCHTAWSRLSITRLAVDSELTNGAGAAATAFQPGRLSGGRGQ